MSTLTLRSLFLAVLLASVATAGQSTAQSPDESAPNRDELERQFASTLSGATLSGHFAVAGEQLPAGLRKEEYTISKVSKLTGDLWLFQARIQYGDNNVTVPLPLPVKWAGNTPVITLDEVPVPGMGTFSARVMIIGDRYAGTWSGGDHGGYMFGVITHPDEEDERVEEGEEDEEEEDEDD